MNLKFAVSLLALLAAATDSNAAFQIILTVGTDIRTIVDGGLGDEDADANEIFIASLPDVGPSGALFNWTSITANWGPSSGIDGDLYGMDVSVASIRSQAAAPTNGTVISIYASLSDLPSLVGEPLAASGNVTMKGNVASGASGTNNRYLSAYDARYDGATDPSQVTTVPTGTELFKNSSYRQGTSAYGFNVFDSDPVTIGESTLSEFSMGMLMSSKIEYTTTPTTTVYDFNYNGSLQLQQVPEPSHTALPVGIAVGIIAMRRRRATR